ncbi:hypothetical protein FRC10_004087 [Ceratobasidium sp. 414]|nr:hypothetical protein FRC10_004087 [Ceratobasidium sp. 414]
MLSSPSTTRPRPPSQTRRPTGTAVPTSPTRMRTQSHTPSRARVRLAEPDAPPPYSQESHDTPVASQRHLLTEIDDMLTVAGSVVRNRERELETAALASRSLLEENRLMFAKREALLARLPISPRSSMSAPQQPTNRSSSWSTCSDDSDADLDTSTATTPRRGASTPDPLEAHRIVTPTHSAAGSVDLSSAALPPAARLVPTQAERIAALHAGLVSPPPTTGHARANSNSSSRRVSVSPAAVAHLQDANTALLGRVQELEEATAKAQTDGAARMRRLQAEAESLRAQLGEAERANEGLRTEAEREREKLRVRTQSAGPGRTPIRRSVDAEEAPRDFAPSATWRPEFRSLRGGVRLPEQPEAPKTPKRSLTTSTAASRGHRAQPNATPPRSLTISPLKHTPLKPSLLRHQRANSYHAGLGLGKPGAALLPAGVVGTVLEEQSETEGGSIRSSSVGNSPVSVKPSPTRTSVGILPFPTSAGVPDEDELDMSPISTRLLAQELVAKINELRSTNEEILHQRDSLKEMLEVAEAEAEELKQVCERLENEIERNSEGTASGGEAPSGRMSRASERARGSGSDREMDRNVRGLELSPLGLGDLDEELPVGWTGSVRGRKRAPGGALESLAAELGVSAEIQAPTDDDATDMDARGPVDLASELMNAVVPKPVTPTAKTFGLPHGPVTPKRSASRSGRVASGTFVTANPGPANSSFKSTTPASIASSTPASVMSATSSAKRGLGNRGMATRAKTNPRRVRKALSSVVFNSTGKVLPSPVSSPTAPEMVTGPVVSVSPVEEAKTSDKGREFMTPDKAGEEKREFVTPEVYLTPVSSLRIPGGVGFPGLTDDEDAAESFKSPTSGRSRTDSTMAQLRAALDPLLVNVAQGKSGAVLALPQPTVGEGRLVRRKRSNLGLLFADERNMEPWETKLRDLYSEIRAMEQDDAGMSSAGEDGWRGSRRARALGRLSLRRRVDDGASDYAADDSEACSPTQTNNKKVEEEKRAAGFDLARRLHQKSMSTFLEVLLLVQFAVVLIVFVYTAVRRGPKAVLGAQKRS